MNRCFNYQSKLACFYAFKQEGFCFILGCTVVVENGRSVTEEKDSFFDGRRGVIHVSGWVGVLEVGDFFLLFCLSAYMRTLCFLSCPGQGKNTLQLNWLPLPILK